MPWLNPPPSPRSRVGRHRRHAVPIVVAARLHRDEIFIPIAGDLRVSACPLVSFCIRSDSGVSHLCWQSPSAAAIVAGLLGRVGQVGSFVGDLPTHTPNIKAK